MKNLFKCFFALFALFALCSCESKRPGTSENFVIDISGTSILKGAEVTLYSEGKEAAKTTTDENGKFEMKDVSSATGLLISVCKGAFHSVASEKDVDFTGCLENYIPAAQEDVSAVVDFLSTFIAKYDETLEEKTALEEWSEYLSITTSPAPELQEALTDATKRYLWQQGLSKLAEQVSQANNITPESMFSTENLFNLLVADLTDDAVINGSTKTKIGNMDINALVLKNYIADAIPKVSETFSAADLSEWTDKIRYSDAKFLGGEGKGSTNNEIEISLDIYPEGSKGAHPDFYSGNVIVEAAAEPAELVFSLKCYAGESEITNDLEEKNQFEGSFSTLEIEDDTILKIRCDASDGVSIKSVEKEITINNDAPITTATLFEAGTNIVTGTEENPAKSKVDLKVEAKHAKYNIDEVVCSLENYTLKNTATANYQFAAAIDTTELPEGTNTLKCTATMNQNRFSSEFDFIVRNTVVVTVKPYIVNPLSEIKSVDVDCGENFKGHYTALKDISLKRGQICTITVSGGKFQSVTLESIREFGSSLSAVVIPESDADIIITPATTIDEIIYSSRVSAGEDAAATFEKSKDSLLKHFSKAFAWNTEPKNTQSMDAATKYYILLAGLENLAYFMEMQINTNHGAYNIGNIIDLLRDDYSDQTFDGAKNGSKLVFGTENKFELDANFFRYYYATAIKRFLASDFNNTGITNIGTILNQISTNSDQYLFPANSETIAIESDGPIIQVQSFKNLRSYREEDGESEDYIDGELAAYMPLGEETSYLATTGERQPYFAKAFVLNFTVKSNNGNYIDLNSVQISGNGEEVFGFKRLTPTEIAGDGFTDEDTEFSFLVEYDGHNQPKVEKQLEFTVSAEDVAFNGGSATVKAFLDSREPTIDILGDKTATNGADSFFITSRVSDNALAAITYCLDKVTTEIDAETGEEVTTETEIKCKNRIYEATSDLVTLDIAAAEIKEYIDTAAADGTITETDGEYIFRITATDRAANEYTGIKNFVYDTTPPAIPNLEFAGWPEDIVPSLGGVLFVKENFVQFHLKDPDPDIAKWQAAAICHYWNDSLSDTQTSGFIGRTETAYLNNLLIPHNSDDISVCSFMIDYCDAVDNCGNANTSELWVIDNQPPQFNGVDEERSILSECVAESSIGGGGMFPGLYMPQCLDSPNCVNESETFLLGTRQAQLLISFTEQAARDLWGNPGMTVVITSQDSNFGSRECQYAGDGSCTDFFYCNIQGARQGENTFTVTATDYLGNVRTETIRKNVSAALINPGLTMTKSFFTDLGSSTLSWTKSSGITYDCKITKNNDSSFAAKNCTSGLTINKSGGLLNGSGKYTVTLTSTNAEDKTRTDKREFTYFETNDLTATFTPTKYQFIKSNETFAFRANIQSKDNLAQIKKIVFTLRERWKQGQLQDHTTDYPLSDGTFTLSNSGYFDRIVTSRLGSITTHGQYRNVFAEITFADNTSITKFSSSSTSDNAFLYCVMDSDESLNDVTLNAVGNKLYTTYTPPDCLSTNDYSLKAVIPYPANCNGYPMSKRGYSSSNPTNDKKAFTITADNHIYTNSHTHDHGDIAARCGSEIRAFSKDTSVQITYKNGVSYTVKGSSFDWNNVSTNWVHEENYTSEGWHEEQEDDYCNKCKNLPSKVSCEQSSSQTLSLHKPF